MDSLNNRESFCYRIALSCVTGKELVIPDAELRAHEWTLIDLIERLKPNSLVILENGSFKFVPSRYRTCEQVEFDCGRDKGLGYFIIPLVIIGLFSVEKMIVRLTGVTNENSSPSFEAIRYALLPLLLQFGLDNFASFTLEKRGLRGGDGGVITLELRCLPYIHLNKVDLYDTGRLVKLTAYLFTELVPETVLCAMETSLLEELQRLGYGEITVTIERTVVDSWENPVDKAYGFGVTLVGETSSGCSFCVDRTVSAAWEGEILKSDPKVVGARLAADFNRVYAHGGASSFRVLPVVLTALTIRDSTSIVDVGSLSVQDRQVIDDLRLFLGIDIDIKEDAAGRTKVEIKKCGVVNLLALEIMLKHYNL